MTSRWGATGASGSDSGSGKHAGNGRRRGRCLGGLRLYWCGSLSGTGSVTVTAADAQLECRIMQVTLPVPGRLLKVRFSLSQVCH